MKPHAPRLVDLETFHLNAELANYDIWLGGSRPAPKYFSGYLPACFERALEFSMLSFLVGRGQGALEWVFTGEEGGFTVEMNNLVLQVRQRYYDSEGHHSPELFYDREGGMPMNHWQQQARHLNKYPEKPWFETTKALPEEVHSLAVVLSHNMMLRVLVNGEELLTQRCLIDVNRHQLRLKNEIGEVQGRLLGPAPSKVSVQLLPGSRHQTMIGFGGTGIATAYTEFSEEGKEQWWRYVCEYNLLVQRDYPNGLRLKQDRSNWDSLEDATPHYYGDNFPNGNITDFDYNKKIQQLGGEVWFEFWQFPPWVNRREKYIDEKGYERMGGVDVGEYARIMVDYCRTAKERTGRPPTIVGIQNESNQAPESYHSMTQALRQALDEAGFPQVKIHMSDASYLSGKSFRAKNADATTRAKTFSSNPNTWSLTDYASAHMYDYQEHLYDPDSFDSRLFEFKEIIGDKPFLSNELAINDAHLQGKSYRLALFMAQLIHKNLTLLDACGIAWCWTLLNVVQPSFGWTRSLFVPDRQNDFFPKPSSNLLRVFGAYSRRIQRGMTRISLETNHPDLLACAFTGKGSACTLVFLNRSNTSMELNPAELPEGLCYRELCDPYRPNTLMQEESTLPTIPPGGILTLSNVPLYSPGS
jgi:O-glycosyl hydrolase